MTPRDPNAMDIRKLTTDERTRLMKMGACFRCQKAGHMAKQCMEFGNSNNNNPSTSTPKKWMAAELKAQIQNLDTKEQEELTTLLTQDF